MLFHLPGIGEFLSINIALKGIEVSGHGAVDEVEGVVWIVEPNNSVGFFNKQIKPHKVKGKYMKPGEICLTTLIKFCRNLLEHGFYFFGSIGYRQATKVGAS